MKIEINNEIIEADWILCINSQYYAGPHLITKETNVFENKLVAYVFKDLTRTKLLYYFWLIIIKGDLSVAKSIIKKDFENLKINGINREILSQVDGENFGYKNYWEIKKTNKYINLLVR